MRQSAKGCKTRLRAQPEAHVEERKPTPKATERIPSISRRIVTYAEAVIEWTAAGRPERSEEEVSGYSRTIAAMQILRPGQKRLPKTADAGWQPMDLPSRNKIRWLLNTVQKDTGNGMWMF